MDSDDKEIILEAMECQELLNDWEAGFIADLSDKDDSYPLSERQIECLDKIAEKIR